MKRIITIMLSIVFLSSFSYGATPEEISKSYFELLKQKQWTEIAKLYDKTALKDFRDMMSFLLEIPDEKAPQVLEAFFGTGATKKTVKTMSDADFFSCFLRGTMSQAAQFGQLDFKKVEVLGSVPEGDSLRHVVTRTNIGIGDMSVETMEVISFKKTDDKWSILLQGKMKGMAQRLKKVFESKKIKK